MKVNIIVEINGFSFGAEVDYTISPVEADLGVFDEYLEVNGLLVFFTDGGPLDCAEWLENELLSGDIKLLILEALRNE